MITVLEDSATVAVAESSKTVIMGVDGQLHFGVLVARDPNTRAERLRQLSILQRKFDALPLDDAVAASYGQLAAAVVAAGRQPRARTMDLVIAATAHAHSARLYTRNANDFIGADALVDIIPI